MARRFEDIEPYLIETIQRPPVHGKAIWMVFSKAAYLDELAELPLIQDRALFKKEFNQGNLLILLRGFPANPGRAETPDGGDPGRAGHEERRLAAI